MNDSSTQRKLWKHMPIACLFLSSFEELTQIKLLLYLTFSYFFWKSYLVCEIFNILVHIMIFCTFVKQVQYVYWCKANERIPRKQTQRLLFLLIFALWISLVFIDQWNPFQKWHHLPCSRLCSNIRVYWQKHSNSSCYCWSRNQRATKTNGMILKTFVTDLKWWRMSVDTNL